MGILQQTVISPAIDTDTTPAAAATAVPAMAAPVMAAHAAGSADENHSPEHDGASNAELLEIQREQHWNGLMNVFIASMWAFAAITSLVVGAVFLWRRMRTSQAESEEDYTLLLG